MLPAIVVTFSTIVAYQKSQRNTPNGLQVTVTECATRRRYVYSANSTSGDPWRYVAISIECVACNCGDLFNDRGVSKKPEKTCITACRSLSQNAQPAAGMSTRQNPPQLTHGATLPYRLNVLHVIVVTFSTIVAYPKSQRNMHNGP